MKQPIKKTRHSSGATFRTLVLPLACLVCACTSSRIDPIGYARLAADRIVRDAVFEVERMPQKGYGYPAVADCVTYGDTTRIGVNPPAGTAPSAARGTIFAGADSLYLVGFTATRDAVVRINGRVVFKDTAPGPAFPHEIAYGIYEFPYTASVPLKKGTNTLEIVTAGKASVGILDREGFPAPGTECSIAEYTDPQGTVHTPSPLTEYRIPIAEGAPFRKHPYTEWHYANGTTMFGMLALADVTGDSAYYDLAERFCRFTLENTPLYARQYYGQNSLRTQNFRMFRLSMLDDSSAPALPLLEERLRGVLQPGECDTLLERVCRFVMEEQPRLPDGTFVRPEPKWTIWADDLFMSAPFLLRWARLTGDDTYREEAVRQVFAYDRYLYDSVTGLYHHGWNASLGEPRGVHWGRANGWVAWAVSETLSALPEEHPAFGKIRELHRRHLAKVCEYQTENGLWHQILDDTTSYTETSASAIFVMAMARGIRRGWLDESFRDNALRGWSGVESRIDPATGVVSGICQSTAIGPDPQFYKERKTPPSDPRGMGAVLTAATEVERMLRGDDK